VIGHDPWPSFDFGPRERLLDSLASATSDDDGWDLHSRQSTARFGPHRVERILPVNAQLARFRRGDSTLLVAAFLVSDDSIRAPAARLAATSSDDGTCASAPDSTMSGSATLKLAGEPMLAGVEITDSASGTLARSRVLYPPRSSHEPALSDILLYRGGGDPPESVDSALVRAIPGERVERGQPVGVYWEAYRPPGAGDSARVSITVERIDHGLLRSAFQRIGITQDDSPLRMNWTDARVVVGGTATYAVSLDLANLSSGRYRVSISVAGSDGSPLTTSRELELTDH
jgi:hypothetical protein